jgi:hypothetical protein
MAQKKNLMSMLKIPIWNGTSLTVEWRSEAGGIHLAVIAPPTSVKQS